MADYTIGGGHYSQKTTPASTDKILIDDGAYKYATIANIFNTPSLSYTGGTFTFSGAVNIGDNVTITASGDTIKSFELANTSVESNAAARLFLSTAGGGDSFSRLYNGTNNWSYGLDNSASDAFVISYNATLGTNNAISISTALTTTFGAGGVVFPTSDPGIAGAWWDNAGTLTKSSG